MTKIQKHCRLQKGVNRILTSGRMGLSFLELKIIILEDGEKYRERPKDKEGVLVVLSGRCRLDAPSFSGELGSRKDVFSGPPAGAYLGSGSPFILTGQDRVEVALFQSQTSFSLPSYIVKEETLKSEIRGGTSFTRQVTDIVGINSPAVRLIVGETINEAGNWSSYPSHKHDQDRMPEESLLEEVYLFRFKPSAGFGLMRIYTEDGSLDKPLLLRHNDLVSIPKGYHPVAAAPGYHLYYLWALAGPKRVMKIYEDPEHSWVNRK
ncbi:MAG: 5-deoxy-glucuronate isomerase [Candidatus Omnitrophota bacterium]